MRAAARGSGACPSCVDDVVPRGPGMQFGGGGCPGAVWNAGTLLQLDCPTANDPNPRGLWAAACARLGDGNGCRRQCTFPVACPGETREDHSFEHHSLTGSVSGPKRSPNVSYHTTTTKVNWEQARR